MRNPSTNRLGRRAERLCERRNAPGRAGQLRNDSRDEERPLEAPVPDLHRHLPLAELPVLDDLGDAVDAADRDALLAEGGNHVVRRPGHRPRLDRVVQLAGACDPSLVRRELLIGGEVVAPDDPEEGLEQAGRVRGDADERSAGARIRVRRSRVVRDVPGPLADGAEVGVLREDALQHREEGLGQRDVDDLAPPRGRAFMQGDQCADHGVQRGDRVAEAQADPAGCAIRLAGDVAQAAGRLGDRPECGLVVHRSGLTIPGDSDHDQPRVRGDEGLGIQIPPLEPAGTEVLDEDVALARELPNECLAGWIVEVRRNR